MQQHDWETIARFVVGAFRADAERARATSEMTDLVDELCKSSPKFESLWRENNVISHGEGTKRLKHPVLGDIELEYSGFAVDSRPERPIEWLSPLEAAARAVGPS